MSLQSSPISPAHLDALATIVSGFERMGIWYRATGGLAGNLHGSTWPLHDIDLDYRRAEWPRIEEALGPHLVSRPERYEDDEFKLTLARARIGAVEVELCQLEDGFVGGPSAWHPLDTSLEKRERRSWRHLTLWTLPLHDLIHYKALIGRSADLADLRKLASAPRPAASARRSSRLD